MKKTETLYLDFRTFYSVGGCKPGHSSGSPQSSFNKEFIGGDGL